MGWKITVGSQGAVTLELTDAQGKKIRGNLPDNEALTPRSWQHVCVRYSGGQANSSISILVNGRAGNLRNSSEQHCSATELVTADLKIGGPYPSAGMSDVRVFRRWLLDEEVQLLRTNTSCGSALPAPRLGTSSPLLTANDSTSSSTTW